jgi:Pyridoxamine 5'-phosphate oxidase
MHPGGMASWGEFAAAEPEFAERVLERFTLRKHSTLATLRHDGSPRISGTEVSFDGGELWLGMMPRSLKARDLQRDARLALHSPTEDTPEEDPGSWAGEAKVAGRGLENSDPSGRDEGHRFRVEITEVVLTRVDELADHLVIESWHPGRGIVRRLRR